MKLLMVLSDGINTRDVAFNINDTPIAIKWSETIRAEPEIFENNRFTGWPNGNSIHDYIVLINNCIGTINGYRQVIHHNAYDTMTAEHTNILHKYFEVLRGGVLDPAEFFTSSPTVVQEALEQYNIYIHALEKQQQKLFLSPTITVTFNSPRYLLEPEDYQHFTYDWQYGTVYINYCEVGKHLLELFIDNDEVVGENNIRPLCFMKADFKVKFSTVNDPLKYGLFKDKVDNWLTLNHNRFNDLGIKPERYALGLIPVATIAESTDMFDLINELKSYSHVESVRILD